METYYDIRKLNFAFWVSNLFIVFMLFLWGIREVFPEWRGYQARYRTLEYRLVWRELVDAAKLLTGEPSDRVVEQALRPALRGAKRLPEALAELAAKHPETPYAAALKERESSADLRTESKQKSEAWQTANEDLMEANRRFQEANAQFNWATDEVFNAVGSKKMDYMEIQARWRKEVVAKQKVVEEKSVIKKAKEREKLSAEVRASEAESKATRMESGDEELGVELEGLKRRVDLGGLVTRLQSVETLLNPFWRAGIGPLEILHKVRIEQSLIETAGAETIEETQRCMTCHLGIDKPDMIQERWAAMPEATRKQLSLPGQNPEELATVYKLHPRFNEFFSNHPIERFGCTSCHRGQGVALTAASAHGRYPEAGERKGQQFHHVERPFFHAKYREAGCARCHGHETEITGATKLNAGKRMFEQYGCVGCHEMSAFKDAPKIGPSLEKLAAKLDPQWMFRWIRDPRHFSPRTKMPQFFESGREFRVDGQDTVHGKLRVVGDMKLVRFQQFGKGKVQQALDDARSEAEVKAIVSFLWNASNEWMAEQRGNARRAGEQFEFPDELAAGGDAKRGEALFTGVGQRGCTACHTIGGNLDDETSFEYKHRVETEPGGRPFGPDLSFAATKLKPGFIVRWLQDPKKYMKHARMPNLRLTEQEAQDLTAYLVEQRYAKDLPPVPPVEELTNKTLVAQGEQFARQYGCVGCHDIPRIDSVDWERPSGVSLADWEKLWGGKSKLPPPRPSKIGADLAKVGVKAFHELDFGERVHDMDTTVPDWLKAKVLNPRQFRPGRDIKGAPNLRMPNYHLSNAEADTLLTVLLSYTGEEVGEHFEYKPDETTEAVERGRRILRRRNCVGCHIVDFEYNAQMGEFSGRGGDLGTDEMVDANMAPPSLFSIGLRTNKDWLFGFLGKPEPIRMWLNARMPTFGFHDEESTQVIRYFNAIERHRAEMDERANPMTPPKVRPVVEELRNYMRDAGEVLLKFEKEEHVSPQQLKIGKFLFDQLQCASCHPNTKEEFDKLDEEKKTSAAPPLGLSRKRIAHRFMVEWLTDPQFLQPKTNMPNFFGDLQGGYKSVDVDFPEDVKQKFLAAGGRPYVGNRAKQARAIRDYAMSLGSK